MKFHEEITSVVIWEKNDKIKTNRIYIKKHCLMNSMTAFVFSSLRIPWMSIHDDTSHVSRMID